MTKIPLVLERKVSASQVFNLQLLKESKLLESKCFVNGIAQTKRYSRLFREEEEATKP